MGNDRQHETIQDHVNFIGRKQTEDGNTFHDFITFIRFLPTLLVSETTSHMYVCIYTCALVYTCSNAVNWRFK